MQQDNDKPNDQQGTQAQDKTQSDGLPDAVTAWLAAPREVLTKWEQAESEAFWDDEALNAGVHFSLPVVSPLDAAILLHGQDPDSTSPEDAAGITSDDTTPQDFKTLRRVFEATADADPRNRTLLDWMHLADRSGCKYHRWARSYAAHRFGIFGPQSPVSTPEPKQEKLHGNIVLVNVTAQANHYQQQNVHHHPAPAPEQAPPATEPAPAQAQAQAPPPVSAPFANPSPEPEPLTTGDIANVFDGLGGWNEQQWMKPLGDKPKWLRGSVAIPGKQGSHETRWNPVTLGAALIQQKGVAVKSVRARFQKRKQLMPWRDAWKTYEADYLDNDS